MEVKTERDTEYKKSCKNYDTTNWSAWGQDVHPPTHFHTFQPQETDRDEVLNFTDSTPATC